MGKRSTGHLWRSLCRRRTTMFTSTSRLTMVVAARNSSGRYVRVSFYHCRNHQYQIYNLVQNHCHFFPHQCTVGTSNSKLLTAHFPSVTTCPPLWFYFPQGPALIGLFTQCTFQWGIIFSTSNGDARHNPLGMDVNTRWSYGLLGLV